MSGEHYKAMVVDDEPLARSIVKEHLADFPQLTCIGECENGFEAVKMAGELKPDLVFLDIQMPKLDGFEVLELLSPQPAVIFVTAYDQHALKAFEFHAVDYLLKPFSQERFTEAVQRALEHLNKGQTSPVEAAELTNTAKGGTPLDRVVVKDGHKVTLIPLSKVDYFQAQDDYVLIKTREKGYLKQQTLASLEKRLDAQHFLKIHRSFIIHLDRLVRLEQTDTESWNAIMADGSKLPVSRSGYARLKPLLNS